MNIQVRCRDGLVHSVSCEQGLSVMEAVRNHGIDELLALCGGCCACATCHVYVDAQSLEKLPAMSADEDALLDSSSSRQANSRLSCQLQCCDRLDGLSFQIAPED